MERLKTKEKRILKWCMIALCVVIAVVSNVVLAKNFSSPDYKLNKETITYLDEKKTTALELCAGAIALSFAVNKEFFWKLGVKILLLALALYAVIPVSVHVSQLIYSTYQESIDMTLAETENLVSQTEDAANAQEKEAQDTQDEGFLSGLIDKAKDTINQAKDTIGGATEQFKYMLNKFVDGLAVLIVTTCLIPILVMIFFIWIVKIILSTAVTQPGAVVPKIIKTGKENRE